LLESDVVGARKQRTQDGGELAGAIKDDLARAELDQPIGLARSGFRTQLVLEQLGRTRAARDAEREAAPPDWDALCRLEQMLRQRRGAIAALGLRSHAELLDTE
jgi:hypothetical protein